MKNKIIAAAIGFFIGVLTLPLLIIAWPVGIALFLYNERDKEDVLEEMIR